jgi:hypothetical protein
MATVHCPAALALQVIERGMLRLSSSGSPHPAAAQELLRLAHRLEIDTGKSSAAVPWLVRYLADCAAIEA